MRSRTPKWIWAALVAPSLAAGCSAEEPVAQSVAPIVDPGSPVAGGNVTGAMPALPEYAGSPATPVHGALPTAAITAADAHSVHEGSYSNGVDVAASPATDAATWRARAPGDVLTSAWEFGGALDDALAASGATMGNLDINEFRDTLDEVFDLFSTEHATPSDINHFAGYAPLRARWLTAQWGNPDAMGVETEYSYAPPSHLGDVRQRGARLFCSARAAAFRQPASHHSMGRIAAFKVPVFGHDVEFGVLEPTAQIDAPGAYVDRPGAQSFTAPLQLGVKITPIGGLGLPGLPEVRYPVTLVTGDTEVGSAAVWRTFRDGYAWTCSGGLHPVCFPAPTSRTDYTKFYQTVTHADAIQAHGATLDKNIHTLLFTMGPLSVDLGLDFQIGVGAPAVGNDRVVNTTASGWPSPPRVGHADGGYPFGDYDDGNWTFGGPNSGFGFPVPPNATGVLVTTLDRGPHGRALYNYDPLLLRGLEDDDHHVDYDTYLQLGATLSGTVGLDYGPAHIGFTAHGTLTGRGGMLHQVRDGALMTTAPMEAVAAVTVAPKVHANATIDGGVDFDFVLDLGWLGSIDEHFPIITFGPKTLAETSSEPFGERGTLRLGTGASEGDPMLQPQVPSHFPQTDPYGTFDGNSVPECLAHRDEPAPPLPPPCAGDPPTGAPPHGEVCLYAGNVGNATFGSPVCADIDAAIDGMGPLDGAQRDCLVDMLEYLCSPTSREQTFDGATVVGHVFTSGDPSEGDRLAHVVSQCVPAFVDLDGLSDAERDAAAQAWFDGTLHFTPCMSDATLLHPSDPVGTPAAGTPEPTTCD